MVGATQILKNIMITFLIDLAVIPTHCIINEDKVVVIHETDGDSSLFESTMVEGSIMFDGSWHFLKWRVVAPSGGMQFALQVHTVEISYS